jgi:glycosyltransferase involved in cell wall biosynthesis
MKIVYVLPTLAVNGGTERIVSEKASYLASHFGYDVTIISLFQSKRETNQFELSERVQQINLGIPYYLQYKFGYPKRFFIKIKTQYRLRKSLRKTIQAINPDIVISISYANAELVSSVPCKAIKIVESHEPRELVMSKIYNHSLISRIYIKYFYFHFIEKNADVIVTLTEGAKSSWHKARKVVVIPDFSMMAISNFSNCKTKKIIAVGRLNKEKGFDRLIKVWELVSNKFPDWQLNIYGDGILKKELNDLIKVEHVSNVALQGPTNNISREYADSSICVVTSYYEGFSLVILEAMKHGVPCVAFDCPYGPRTIIENNKNGYIVENGNITLFAEKVCELIENDQLRQQFSKKAIECANFYDSDKIMLQWRDLFEELINKA